MRWDRVVNVLGAIGIYGVIATYNKTTLEAQGARIMSLLFIGISLIVDLYQMYQKRKKKVKR